MERHDDCFKNKTEVQCTLITYLSLEKIEQYL